MAELEQEVAHLQELQAKHSKNIRALEETLANYGMKRPLDLLNELEFEQEQLREVEKQLVELVAQAGTEEIPAAPQCPSAKLWWTVMGATIAWVIGCVLIALSVRLVPTTNTPSTAATISPSTEVVKVDFELPSMSSPVDVTIRTESGLTVFSFHITPGTRQTVELPPGNYIYEIESEALVLPTGTPPPPIKILEDREWVTVEEDMIIRLPPYYSY